jgi:hypothetical protein
MPWIAAGGAIVGGMMAGDSARSAANTSAQAQLEAARIAAEASRFVPVGVSRLDDRFAKKPTYTYDASGRLTGVEGGLTPEMQAYQDRLLALAGGGLSQAEQAQQQYAPLQGAAGGLFNLGQQYLAQSPEQAAQQYMAKQQELLAPSRERQYAQLQNQLFQTGRGGLSVGATGMRPSGAAGLGATNPETEAYYNAMAQQDAALAANAQQAGQQQTAFGAGLFGTGANLLGSYQQGQVGALSPFQTSLGLASSLTELGNEPIRFGAELGGRTTSAGANSGNYLFRGGMGAAGTMQEANAYNPYGSALISASTNQQFQGGAKNYLQGQMLNAQYGSENVYGRYGKGTVPTEYTSFD